jgi:hypothetical protein
MGTVGAKQDNKNAEKWTLEEAEKLFNAALKLSHEGEYDFIGEIAKELNTYRGALTYLIEVYPELKRTYRQIIGNLEANCFLHSKKQTINSTVGIFNLKVNHGWQEVNKTENVNTNLNADLSPERVREIAEKLKRDI